MSSLSAQSRLGQSGGNRDLRHVADLNGYFTFLPPHPPTLPIPPAPLSSPAGRISDGNVQRGARAKAGEDGEFERGGGMCPAGCILVGERGASGGDDCVTIASPRKWEDVPGMGAGWRLAGGGLAA